MKGLAFTIKHGTLFTEDTAHVIDALSQEREMVRVCVFPGCGKKRNTPETFHSHCGKMTDLLDQWLNVLNTDIEMPVEMLVEIGPPCLQC